MYFKPKAIAIIMLLTFFVSGIEGYCLQSKPSANKISASVLSFENNDLVHTVEATINESVTVGSNSAVHPDKALLKFSTPDLLSSIKSITSGTLITSYKKAVLSIYFSNRLFLIFSHFTI